MGIYYAYYIHVSFYICTYVRTYVKDHEVKVILLININTCLITNINFCSKLTLTSVLPKYKPDYQ